MFKNEYIWHILRRRTDLGLGYITSNEYNTCQLRSSSLHSHLHKIVTPIFHASDFIFLKRELVDRFIRGCPKTPLKFQVQLGMPCTCTISVLCKVSDIGINLCTVHILHLTILCHAHIYNKYQQEVTSVKSKSDYLT